MKTIIIAVLFVSGCIGAPFTLLEESEPPEREVLIIERGELVPPASSVVVPRERPTRPGPDAGKDGAP